MAGEDRHESGFPPPAALLHLLYDVALEPERLPQLVEAWEAHLATGGAAHCPDLAAHVARARRLLNRLPRAGQEEDGRAILAAIPRAPAFLSDGLVRVAACNRPAQAAFGVAENSPLAALPFEAADVVRLSSTIRRVARRAERVVTLRLRSTRTRGPIVLRVSALDGMDARPMALVVAAEPVWPDGMDLLVQETFGLTSAEVGILRGLVLGLPIRAIAEARGRSVDTVRTQLRSILAKTESHSQTELIRSTMALMDLALAPGGGDGADHASGGLEELAPRNLILPDGRRLDWIEFGAPDGAPVLHLHGDFGLVRWTAPAERAARTAGLRVIVPIRAGYGMSDPLPEGAPFRSATVEDLLALLDHCGIGRAAAVALGADLRLALALAAQRPGLLAGVVAAAFEMPAGSQPAQERLARWPCFLEANARRAPEMLGFLVQAAFAHARQVGKERFLAAAAGGASADRAALRDPDLREAMVRGSDVCLSGRTSAHEAFSRSLIDRATDWSGALGATNVPVLLLQGAEDPLAPAAHVAGLAARHPGLRAEIVPSGGRLLFFAQWSRSLAAIGNFLNE